MVIPIEEWSKGSLVVAPDSDSELFIDLMPIWLAAKKPGNTFQFLPFLTGRAKIEREVSSDELAILETGSHSDTASPRVSFLRYGGLFSRITEDNLLPPFSQNQSAH